MVEKLKSFLVSNSGKLSLARFFLELEIKFRSKLQLLVVFQLIQIPLILHRNSWIFHLIHNYCWEHGFVLFLYLKNGPSPKCHPSLLLFLVSYVYLGTLKVNACLLFSLIWWLLNFIWWLKIKISLLFECCSLIA